MRVLVYLLFLSFSSFSQTRFLDGYYINKQGARAECLVAQADYDKANDTGAQLEFRKDASAPIETISMSEVKEFGIGTVMKFIRAEVELEDSSLYDASLPVSGEPLWKVKSLLLRVWVEGNASLYSYLSEKGEKFFFSVADKGISITQLLFMRWHPEEVVFKERKDFQQQLFRNLACVGWPVADFKKLTYDERDLRRFFQQANAKCGGGSSFLVFRNNVDNPFQIRLTAEMALRTMRISASNSVGEYLNDSFAAFNPGIECEIVAFSGRFTGVVGIDFFKLNATPDPIITPGSVPNIYYETSSRIDMAVINVPIGARYYIWNSIRNRVFVDVSLVFCKPMGEISLTRSMYVQGELAVAQVYRDLLDTNFSFNFGAGYTFNKKWGARVILGTQRNYLTSYATGKTEALSNDVRFALRYTFL
ncbi:MAG TPA: hypothetical protein VK183_07395 [Flavobacterium sp.]|nr:hypothetical protein [Flavobacterium sp.]